MIKVLKRIDKPLLIISTILFALGLVTIYSASNVTAYMLNDADPSRYFMKESIFLIVGVFVCLVFIMIPTKRYGPLSWLATFVISGVIVLLALLGQVINGMSGWINYNGLGIQPSEFAKIAIIPLIATFYDRNLKSSNDFKKMLVPMIVAAIVAPFVVVIGVFIFAITGILMVFLRSGG